MKQTSSRIIRTVVALIALVASPLAIGEVGVVVGQDGITIQSGPYLGSIIENADPIGAIVWTRQTLITTNRVVLNEDGFTNGDGRPSMTRNPISGLPIVTWGKNNGTGFDIVESHFENGQWSAPTVISSSVSTALDPEPRVVVDKQSGAVHVVYCAGDSAPAVMLVEAPSDLSSWSAPALVSQVAEYALRPSPVVHQGTVLVAYESHGSGVGSTPRQIVVATSDGSGGFNHTAVTNTHLGDPNRPQLHAGIGDTLWLDWVDDLNDMAWSVWHPASGWGAVQIEGFADSGDRDFHARARIKKLATQ